MNDDDDDNGDRVFLWVAIAALFWIFVGILFLVFH